MNTEFIVNSIAKITKDWLLPDWVKFRTLNDYWTVKDRYHKEWVNKGNWRQSAYNNWLIWKLEKLEKYNNMSFAEDFGHDIPNDAWDGFAGDGNGTSTRGDRIRTFENVIKEVTTDKAVLIKFEDGNKAWLPKSKVEFDGNSVNIPAWLFNKLNYL